MLTGGKVTIFDQIKIYLAGLRAQGSGHRAQGTGHGERTASGVRPAACGQRRAASGVENMKGRIGEKETKRRREGCIGWIPSSGEPAPLSGGLGVGFG